MGFLSASSIARESGNGRGGRGRSSSVSSGLRFLTTTATKLKGSQEKSIQLSFTLYQDVIKESRLMIGDRVDVLFDPTDLVGLIKRVREGGYSLTASQKNTKRLSIKMTWFKGMPRLATGTSELLENVSVTDEGIMFRLPRNTSFE